MSTHTLLFHAHVLNESVVFKGLTEFLDVISLQLIVTKVDGLNLTEDMRELGNECNSIVKPNLVHIDLESFLFLPKASQINLFIRTDFFKVYTRFGVG